MTTVNIHDVRVNRINNILQNYLKQNIFLPLYGFSIVYFELQYRWSLPFSKHNVVQDMFQPCLHTIQHIAITVTREENKASSFSRP